METRGHRPHPVDSSLRALLLPEPFKHRPRSRSAQGHGPPICAGWYFGRPGRDGAQIAFAFRTCAARRHSCDRHLARDAIPGFPHVGPWMASWDHHPLDWCCLLLPHEAFQGRVKVCWGRAAVTTDSRRLQHFSSTPARQAR